MKKILLSAAFTVFALNAFSAITIQYYNKDSKNHKMDVKIDGSVKQVEFDASKTSSVTIQGGAKTCVIATSCGKVEVKDGAKIEIKDGCIKITN